MRMNFDETDESDEHFRQRISELIRATIIQCYIEDTGYAPPKEIPDSVVREVVCKIRAPENEDELVTEVRKLYRQTRNIESMRKGLN